MSCGLHPWYVVAVKARREAHVSGILEQMGYEPYFPSYVAVKKYSDRIKKVEQPLFPGYLFMRLDIRYRLPILKLSDVLHFLGDQRGPAAIPDPEIEAIARSMTTALPWQPWPFLEAGDEVTLINGPLSGVEGKLVSLRGEARLVVGITLLQRAIAVEVDRTWVRPRDVANFGPGQHHATRQGATRITQ
jgi:transcription antitermination factor NusG